jgi:tetratricopeptide (TPR) repeat protein
MLYIESPLDAYRSDLARNANREDFGGADTVWLLTAHCLSRVVRTGVEDRGVSAAQSASALRDLLGSDPEGCQLPEPERRDLSQVIDGLTALTDRDSADAVARGVRGMTSRMSDAGAVSMAYTTLASTRELVGLASDRERGLLAADQARVARLLGDLDTSEELYQTCSDIAERSVDFALLSRACLGRGVINRVRGNYPRARVFFERGLELGETAHASELVMLAHQGLTICFAIGHDFDRALKHAWATYLCSEGDRALEGEALGNLAQLCLDAGFPRAALQGFAAVLDRTEVLRVRLSMLGGAAVAAARCDKSDVVERVASEAERHVLRSALAYENAQTLFHLATAYGVMDNTERASAYLARARRLAKVRGFFELLHACENAKLSRATVEAIAPHTLSQASQEVVASLAGMDAGDTAGVLALRS